jgi:hypothetical protein
VTTQNGAIRALRPAAVAAGCILLALGAAYYLTYEPSPRVGILWRSGITEDRRAALERRFLLVNPGPEGDRLMYDLLDTSRANLEAIVNERDVADTDRISRERFEIPFDIPYGESWMWVAHRTPVLRIPAVVETVTVASLLVVGAALVAELRRRRRRRSDRA